MLNFAILVARAKIVDHGGIPASPLEAPIAQRRYGTFVIVTPGDTLEIDPTWLGPHGASVAKPDGQLTMAEIEWRGILEALERCGGKIYGRGGAAEALGLKPSTLYGKMRKHRIRTERRRIG